MSFRKDKIMESTNKSVDSGNSGGPEEPRGKQREVLGLWKYSVHYQSCATLHIIEAQRMENTSVSNELRMMMCVNEGYWFLIMCDICSKLWKVWLYAEWRLIGQSTVLLSLVWLKRDLKWKCLDQTINSRYAITKKYKF